MPFIPKKLAEKVRKLQQKFHFPLYFKFLYHTIMPIFRLSECLLKQKIIVDISDSKLVSCPLDL